MNRIPNKPLTPTDGLTLLFIDKGVSCFDAAVKLVANLPYGRNAHRSDFSLVLSEGQGTCSSKHALIKKLADFNGVANVELILGLYRMIGTNTKHIEPILNEAQLDWIPEAHCYLKVNGQRIDLTFPGAYDFQLENDLIAEFMIEPADVVERKVEMHQDFMRKWLEQAELTIEFNELWCVREACIASIQRNSKA